MNIGSNDCVFSMIIKILSSKFKRSVAGLQSLVTFYFKVKIKLH